jgi:hypothetical protein
MQWKGPYTILKKIIDMDNTIDMGGKMKTFYANLLKTYIERYESTCGILLMCVLSSLIDFSDEDADEAQDPILSPPTIQTETVEDIHFSERLKICAKLSAMYSQTYPVLQTW